MGVPLDMLPGGVGFLVTITDGLALVHAEAGEVVGADEEEEEEEEEEEVVEEVADEEDEDEV